MIERTHLLSVNSSHCSTKQANLPPTGISGCGKMGSGKGWVSELVEDEASLEEGSTPLSIVLFSGQI